jgi:hypothetical protein
MATCFTRAGTSVAAPLAERGWRLRMVAADCGAREALQRTAAGAIMSRRRGTLTLGAHEPVDQRLSGAGR